MEGVGGGTLAGGFVEAVFLGGDLIQDAVGVFDSCEGELDRPQVDRHVHRAVSPVDPGKEQLPLVATSWGHAGSVAKC